MYDIKTERKEKQMTLEQLRAAKQISNTNGRPAFHLTDEKWQKEFAIRKSFLQPYDKNIWKGIRHMERRKPRLLLRLHKLAVILFLYQRYFEQHTSRRNGLLFLYLSSDGTRQISLQRLKNQISGRILGGVVRK